MRRGVIISFLLLTACIPSVEPSSPAPQLPPSAAQPQQQTPAATLQCHADLRARKAEFRVLPDRTFDGGCSAIGTVQLLDIGVPTTNLSSMTCPLALQFTRWTQEAVQPAANTLLGSPVRRIETFGTYACRPVNSQIGGRLSEHGRANAVDVSAFVLADGRRVTVLDGWNSQDEKVRAFLRSVHQAGCRSFAIGIGPDANAAHRDHFHFDMGQGPYCR
jgi:hypothetical protein